MILAPVRAMTSGRATPLTSLLLAVTSTLSCRSARRVPSAIACDGARSSINAPSASTPATLTRSAVPWVITQAELSFTSVPSGDREICLVSGPPSLVSLVSSISIGGGGGTFFSAGGSSGGRGGVSGASVAGSEGCGSGSGSYSGSGYDFGSGSGSGFGWGAGSGGCLGAGAAPVSSSHVCLASPQLRPNLRSTCIGTSSATASRPSCATRSASSGDATEQSSASCICSSGTIPSRQQARIHSLVWRAAEPWIRAFIALLVSARRVLRRYQGWLGSATRRSASSREHGPMPSVQAISGASQASQCRRAPS